MLPITWPSFPPTALGKLNSGKGSIGFQKLEELPLGVISQILEHAAGKRHRS